MIVSRTPLRISLFGGGTDYPEWYMRHSGVTIGFAIDRYVYVTARQLSPLHPYRFSLYWREVERAQSAAEINHPVVREVLRKDSIDTPMGFSIIGDLPARNGLGSSSAFTNGFIRALHPDWIMSHQELAEKSIHVERSMLQEAGGHQDQYMTAFGGMKRIDFSKDGATVTPVYGWDWFARCCFLVHTGVTRPEDQVSIEQKRATDKGDCDRFLCDMLDIAEHGWQIIANDKSHAKLPRIATLLERSWRVKRNLSSQITSPTIDALHERCLTAGSLGGKLCGAGSGGFLLELVQPDDQATFLEKMADVPVLRVGMDHYGSVIVMR